MTSEQTREWKRENRTAKWVLIFRVLVFFFFFFFSFQSQRIKQEFVEVNLILLLMFIDLHH